jgi:hypothetical protein
VLHCAVAVCDIADWPICESVVQDIAVASDSNALTVSAAAAATSSAAPAPVSRHTHHHHTTGSAAAAGSAGLRTGSALQPAVSRAGAGAGAGTNQQNNTARKAGDSDHHSQSVVLMSGGVSGVVRALNVAKRVLQNAQSCPYEFFPLYQVCAAQHSTAQHMLMCKWRVAWRLVERWKTLFWRCVK